MMKEEMTLAMNKMKTGKAAGKDGVTVEMWRPWKNLK